MKKLTFFCILGVWALMVALILWIGRVQTPVEEPAETPTAAEPAETQPQEIDPPVVVTQVIYQPWEVAEDDARLLAQVAWCEARGCSVTQQAAVMWCVLNRVDDPRFPNSIRDVICQPNQFYFLGHAPVTDELLALARDVLVRWQTEDLLVDSGRVLPANYLWFWGDGEVNRFRNEYRGGETWDWRLGSPYED